jgi:hypothetical protein
MTSSNVETLARTMRYQALLNACRAYNVRKLLVGHHEDDQYETVLSRLSLSHNLGLAGIASLNNIPECTDLYGAESGSLRQDSIPKDPERTFLGVQGIETGGIQLGRPLLSFSKDRLIATCEKYNVPWIEDSSNKDKTLTSRNAIRFILQNHKLPAALGKESLLKLGRIKDEQKKASMQQIEYIFNNSDIQLDITTGFLTAVVPEPGSPSQNSFDKADIRNETRAEHNKEIDILLAHRLASLVGPIFYPPRSTFANAAREEDNFTAGGVHFVRSQDDSQKHTKTWTLRRRPLPTKPMSWDSKAGYTSKEPNLVLSFPPNTKNRYPIFQLWDGRYWIRIQNHSRHTLWVRPMTVELLASLRDLLRCRKVRLDWFQPAPQTDRESSGWDWNKMPQSAHMASLHGPFAVQALDKILSKVAKGLARFTLPVIEARDLSVQVPETALAAKDSNVEAHDSGAKAQQDEAKPPNWQGNILAFPTLGLRVIRQGQHDDWPAWIPQKLKWDIRYKKIDLGRKKLEECVVGMKRSR